MKSNNNKIKDIAEAKADHGGAYSYDPPTPLYEGSSKINLLESVASSVQQEQSK